MSIDAHTVSFISGSLNLRQDRPLIAFLPNQATVIAGGAGLAVTLAVTGLDLPIDSSGNPLYGVVVTPGVASAVSISLKTRTGFTVTLTPLAAGVTLAASFVDIFVFA